MQFDWYQATLNAKKDDVFGRLTDQFPYTDIAPCRPANGYTEAAHLLRGDDVKVTAMWGGVNGGDTTHVKATGTESIWFSTFARKEFPDHQVSRADVAIDYYEEKSFQRLQRMFIAYAKKNTKLKTATAGDWIKNESGRTLYLGSRTSPAFLRLYEKGRQLDCQDYPHWTRCELEVKPGKKGGKEWLATATPLEVWGASSWSIDIAALLEKSGIERAPTGTVRVPTDDERATKFMLKQYGPLLERLYRLSGEDPEAFGRFIMSQVCPEEFGITIDGQLVQAPLNFEAQASGQKAAPNAEATAVQLALI